MGAKVGDLVCKSEGEYVGDFDGKSVGDFVGDLEGKSVGARLEAGMKFIATVPEHSKEL